MQYGKYLPALTLLHPVALKLAEPAHLLMIRIHCSWDMHAENSMPMQSLIVHYH